MISLQIQDIKDFMSRLLLSPAFDAFLVVEGSVTTFSAFVIDGRLRPDYYAKEEQEELGLNGRHFTRWQELRPFCLALIKGKRTPLGFHFTFQLSPENTEKHLVQTDSVFSPADVNGHRHLPETVHPGQIPGPGLGPYGSEIFPAAEYFLYPSVTPASKGQYALGYRR